MGTVTSKEDQLLFKYPKRPSNKYIGTLPLYSYNGIFCSDLADYSLENNLLSKRNMKGIIDGYCANNENYQWLLINFDKLVTDKLIMLSDSTFREICFYDIELFTKYISNIKNTAEVESAINDERYDIVENIIVRFPESFNMVSENGTHINIIKLCLNKYYYNIDQLLQTVTWNVCDYDYMVLDMNKPSIWDTYPMVKLNITKEKVFNQIVYDSTYINLFIKHNNLFDKFHQNIKQSDSYLKYITSVPLLIKCKQLQLPLSASLYQQYLDQDNYKCFEWVYYNIPYDNGELNSGLVYILKDITNENCNYDWENIVDERTNFLLFLYDHKEELHVDIIKSD